MEREEAFEKLKNWCAYQERSQFDVRKKLLSLKISSSDIDSIIVDLIEENFLNEERFAMAFVGGKFRIKHWGKQKIKMELRKHQVSEYCINKALASLSNDHYEAEAAKLIQKKLDISKHTDRRKLYYSIMNYMLSKGYETNLVSKQLNQLLEIQTDES